jgi:hypothetical protein
MGPKYPFLRYLSFEMRWGAVLLFGSALLDSLVPLIYLVAEYGSDPTKVSLYS